MRILLENSQDQNCCPLQPGVRFRACLLQTGFTVYQSTENVLYLNKYCKANRGSIGKFSSTEKTVSSFPKKVSPDRLIAFFAHMDGRTAFSYHFKKIHQVATDVQQIFIGSVSIHFWIQFKQAFVFRFCNLFSLIWQILIISLYKHSN